MLYDAEHAQGEVCLPYVVRGGEADHSEDVGQFGAGEQVRAAGELRRGAAVAHALRGDKGNARHKREPYLCVRIHTHTWRLPEM